MNWSLASTLVRILVGAFLTAAMGTGSAQAQAPTPVEITFSYHSALTKSTLHRTMEWYFAEAEKRSNGRIKFKPYWGTLLEATEALDGVSQGIADSAFVVPAYWPDKLPLASAGANTILFALESIEEGSNLAWKLYDEFPQIAAEFARYNQKLLWQTSSVGSLVIFSKNPITKLPDFRGLKVRLPGPVSPWFSAIGATGVAISPTEVYDALSKGVVGAALAGLESGYRLKWPEVSKYVLDFGAGEQIFSWSATMNLSKFNALPGDVQKILDDLGRELPQVMAANWVQDRDTLMGDLKKAGVTVTKLSDEDRAAWRKMDAIKKTREDWVIKATARGLPARAFMDRLVQLLGY